MSRALRADLIMLFTAILWGSGFIAQQTGMQYIGAFLYSGLRFSLAAIVVLIFLAWRNKRAIASLDKLPLPRFLGNHALLRSGLAMGVLLAIGINLQQVGLRFTSVTHAGFITGLYVIIVPLLGLLYGQRAHLGIWLGAVLAVIGIFLLSASPEVYFTLGDWLQLLCAVVWAAHMLLVGHVAARHDPVQLTFLQFLVCACVSMLLAWSFEPLIWLEIQAALATIVYGGLVGAIGFTLQVVAQKDAIAAHAAILLSLEAVFAALFGAWLLGDSLTTAGYLGCTLMLFGMLLAQLWSKRTSQH